MRLYKHNNRVKTRGSAIRVKVVVNRSIGTLHLNMNIIFRSRLMKYLNERIVKEMLNPKIASGLTIQVEW